MSKAIIETCNWCKGTGEKSYNWGPRMVYKHEGECRICKGARKCKRSEQRDDMGYRVTYGGRKKKAI